MQKILSNSRLNGDFAMQNSQLESANFEETNQDYIEKLKILELSNIIDKWEKEVLFSDNGFYSLKGKEAEERHNEFIEELNKFINFKINEMSFSGTSKDTAVEIKNKKLSSIINKMKIYEQQELKNWEDNICQEAVSYSINRAVLYKNDSDIIKSAYNNGLSVINLIAEKQKWNKKTLNFRISVYKSEFYYALIKAFLSERDINAYKYFSICKELLQIEDKKHLEVSLTKMKNAVIAYNWAKEVFSYNLSDKETEKHINRIEDEDIKKAAKQYLENFYLFDKKQKEQKSKAANEENWQNIISSVENDINSADLYIDYTLSEEHIKAVKHYISERKKNNCIKTDRNKYINLFNDSIENFDEFKNKDISKYRAYFSESDYLFFEKIQKMEEEEFKSFYFDCQYSIKRFNETDIDEKYNYIQLLLYSIEEYKKNHNKNPDLKSRNDIIDLVSERFKNIKKDKEKTK